MTESVRVWNLVVCFVYICSLIRWNILISLFDTKFYDSTPNLLLQRYIRHSCLPQNVLWGEQQLQHRKRQDKTETAHLDRLVSQKWADRPGYCVWLGGLDVMTVGRHHGNDCVEKKWCYCSWITLFWWKHQITGISEISPAVWTLTLTWIHVLFIVCSHTGNWVIVTVSLWFCLFSPCCVIKQVNTPFVSME